MTLDKDLGPPPCPWSLLDEEHDANIVMAKWLRTRRAPTRRALVLWLLQRMVLVGDPASRTARIVLAVRVHQFPDTRTCSRVVCTPLSCPQ